MQRASDGIELLARDHSCMWNEAAASRHNRRRGKLSNIPWLASGVRFSSRREPAAGVAVCMDRGDAERSEPQTRVFVDARCPSRTWLRWTAQSYRWLKP